MSSSTNPGQEKRDQPDLINLGQPIRVITEEEDDRQLLRVVRDLVSLGKKLRDISEKTDASSATRLVIVQMTRLFIQAPTPEAEALLLVALQAFLRRQETRLMERVDVM